MEHAVNRLELRTFRRYLREIERSIARSFKDHSLCCCVTPAQCHVLLELGEGRGRAVNVGELAQRLKLDASTLSRTIDGLVRMGHVHRQDNPENRRSLVLTLTGKGWETLEKINVACDQHYGLILSRLTSDKRDGLIGLLGELVQGFAQDEKDCFAGGGNGYSLGGEK